MSKAKHGVTVNEVTQLHREGDSLAMTTAINSLLRYAPTGLTRVSDQKLKVGRVNYYPHIDVMTADAESVVGTGHGYGPLAFASDEVSTLHREGDSPVMTNAIEYWNRFPNLDLIRVSDTKLTRGNMHYYPDAGFITQDDEHLLSIGEGFNPFAISHESHAHAEDKDGEHPWEY